MCVNLTSVTLSLILFMVRLHCVIIIMQVASKEKCFKIYHNSSDDEKSSYRGRQTLCDSSFVENSNIFV